MNTSYYISVKQNSRKSAKKYQQVNEEEKESRKSVLQKTTQWSSLLIYHITKNNEDLTKNLHILEEIVLVS